MHYIYVRPKADKASLICRREPNKNSNWENYNNKHRDAQKKRSSHKAVELVLRPERESTVGKICERGRSWAGSEREMELWMVRVVVDRKLSKNRQVRDRGTGMRLTERTIGSWFQRQSEAYRKERSVICNEDVGGRARRLNRDKVMQIWRMGGCEDL